ncbi:MAG: helix-turn-helix domain-containing protein [Actinobacteria bacterium]|nr:helix-turn-helix domain-containing protein [Actinomycetota bacterium]
MAYNGTMQGFTAVLTTGIYCRDGCGGAPKPENTIPFAFAAAAEAAGFRACYRCRPYRASGPAPWVGPPELVCRAVRLILDGALDDGSEDQLARRLGVSGRHLRRLFADHVGATPDAVARSRRSHFARRLLDDTDMPITDVAFAAGFGSVRQMNRVMNEVFRQTPTQLRARRRRTDRLVADGGLDLRVPFRGPLDWPAMLAFFAARAIPGVESVDPDAGIYRRTVRIEGFPGVLEVRSGDSGDHLVLRAHLPRWEGLIHVVERVRRVFDLDADLDAVHRSLRKDRALAARLRTHPGLRLPGAWDPFELAVRAVLGQQVTVKGATTLAGRVVERFGVPVPGLEALGLTHLFPEPAALADATLERVGLPRARAATVREMARRALDGSLVFDGSRGLAETVAALGAIPGIGPWTAHYVAMRACGEPDAFPAADLGIRRALGNGRPLTARQAEQRAEPWRPWRAYAAVHLWAGGLSVAPREVPSSRS